MKIKDFFSIFKTKLGSLYAKNKKLFLFVLVFVSLIAFCLISFPKNNENKKESDNSMTEQNLGIMGFKDEVEQKIVQMLLSIDEIKTASAMVVCDESEKYVYLKNVTETSSGTGDNSSKTITEEVVYEKNGSNSSPIIVSKIMPKVVGVWIVINSVSPSTKLAIINSISSVLNISESSISILQER